MPQPMRRQMQLPNATHALLSRVSALRGEPMTDLIYRLFKNELVLLEPEQIFSFVPYPWTACHTYNEQGRCVLLEHPSLPAMVLNRVEATDLHNALAGQTSEVTALTNSHAGHEIRVWSGSRHVSIDVAGEIVSMPKPVAADLAAVIGRFIPTTGVVPTHH